MEGDGERDDFQGNGKSLRETQGENKARRKCTCQTEQQRLASSSTSYVIALWPAELQVRRVKTERKS